MTLEPEFWAAFQLLAAKHGQSVNGLAAQMDAQRGDVGLASYMRVAILRDLQLAHQQGAYAAPAQ